jgi:hypothetical protein
VPGNVVDVTDGTGSAREDPSQLSLSLEQRPVPKILAVQPGHVEGEEARRAAPEEQCIEVRAARRVEADELAIEDRGAGTYGFWKGGAERVERLVDRAQLPEYLKDAARFAYLTGWRKGAVRALEWRDVDMAARTL